MQVIKMCVLVSIIIDVAVWHFQPIHNYIRDNNDILPRLLLLPVNLQSSWLQPI